MRDTVDAGKPDIAAQIVDMLNGIVRREDERAAANHKLRGWHTIRASMAHEIANMVLSGEFTPTKQEEPR